MSSNRQASAIIGLVAILACVGFLYSWRGTAAKEVAPSTAAQHGKGEYVGSEACKDCHEDQFKAFSHTSHAQLMSLASWKEKVTGCESCHGPGKAHTEEGDPKKIISFKNKSSKEISETCLGCHAGREERSVRLSTTVVSSADDSHPASG